MECAISGLQTKNHPDVTVRFKGTPVEDLRRARVACWNSGSEAVRADDVPSVGLRLRLPLARLLSVATVGMTNHVGFRAHELDEHTLAVRFDYLNPGDFGLVEVLYDVSAFLRGTKVDVALDAPVIGARKTEWRRFEPKSRIRVPPAIAHRFLEGRDVPLELQQRTPESEETLPEHLR